MAGSAPLQWRSSHDHERHWSGALPAKILSAPPSIRAESTLAKSPLGRRVRRRAALEFLVAEVLLVGGDEPAMAERVGDAADSVAVELIGDRTGQRGACGHGPGDHGIDVLDVEVEAH